MMMKKISTIFVLLITAILLVNCTGAQETVLPPTATTGNATVQVTVSPTKPEQTSNASPYPEPSSEQALTVNTPSAYPGPREIPDRINPEYPDPVATTPPPTSVPVVVPTPGAETGVVTGQLLSLDSKEPLQQQSIYLGQMVFLTPGPGYTLHIQEKSSPHSITDNEGRFAIGDVPPGSYVLFVWTPFNASTLTDEKSGQPREIKVQAGQTIDIGQKYVNPPK